MAPALLLSRKGSDFLGIEMAESLFRKILVPIDFSPCSEEAFRVALTLAKKFQAELLLLHVIDTGSLATFNQLGLLAVP